MKKGIGVSSAIKSEFVNDLALEETSQGSSEDEFAAKSKAVDYVSGKVGNGALWTEVINWLANQDRHCCLRDISGRVGAAKRYRPERTCASPSLDKESVCEQQNRRGYPIDGYSRETLSLQYELNGQQPTKTLPLRRCEQETLRQNEQRKGGASKRTGRSWGPCPIHSWHLGRY